MKLFDRYIIRQFITTALFSLLAVLVVFIVIDAMEKLDDFIDRQAGWGIIAQYYLFFVPEIIKLIIPVAMLLASLFVTARLSTQNELTAMKSSGISLYRIMVPYMAVAAHGQPGFGLLQRMDRALREQTEVRDRADLSAQGCHHGLRREHLSCRTAPRAFSPSGTSTTAVRPPRA